MAIFLKRFHGFGTLPRGACYLVASYLLPGYFLSPRQE
jgi:hypothetical protein